MTLPVDDIIPRNIEPELAELLNQFSQQLDELVNFGSNILKWDLENVTGGDENLPPILFLRNFLEEIDAISILIRHSSIEPCNNLLRTALENFFYIEYLLEKNTHDRAMSYLTWDLIDKRKFILKTDKKSQSYKEIEHKYKQDKLFKNGKAFITPNADTLLQNNNTLLDSSKYKPFKIEYDATKKRLGNNPCWYSLFHGPRNIEKLAEYLQYPILYEIFYRGWSASIHGTDIMSDNIQRNPEGKTEILQIRNPKQAQQITQGCFNICIRTFKIYIEKRLPNKQPDYLEWYLSLRDFYLKLGEQPLIIMK